MKVLYTLDSLTSGGTENLVLDICRNAEKIGIEPLFIATGGGDLEKKYAGSNFEYIRLQRNAPVDFNLIRKLRKILKDREIKIIQTYQPVSALHFYLAAWGLKNIRQVTSPQGSVPGKKNHLTTRYLSPLLDANVPVSRALFNWLRKETGVDTSKNFYMIYNGIDTSRLKPSGKSLKNELGISGTSLLFGMIANFRSDKTKDQMTICRALPKVFAEYDNAYFVFAGKITEGSEDYFDRCVKFCVENGIGDRVFFLGGRRDVPDILNSLDLFVFSSLMEGLPIAVIEAMFMKVPVIVSDIPQLLEISNQGKCAETFQVKNSQELVKKIIKVQRNPDLQKNLSENAFAFARRNFTVLAHLNHYKILYEQLLAKN